MKSIFKEARSARKESDATLPRERREAFLGLGGELLVAEVAHVLHQGGRDVKRPAAGHVVRARVVLGLARGPDPPGAVGSFCDALTARRNLPACCLKPPRRR